jgi:hypothetical protein
MPQKNAENAMDLMFNVVDFARSPPERACRYGRDANHLEDERKQFFLQIQKSSADWRCVSK